PCALHIEYQQPRAVRHEINLQSVLSRLTWHRLGDAGRTHVTVSGHLRADADCGALDLLPRTVTRGQRQRGCATYGWAGVGSHEDIHPPYGRGSKSTAGQVQSEACLHVWGHGPFYYNSNQVAS